MTDSSRSVHGWGRFALWVVLALMLLAVVYAGAQGIRNWSVISV